MPSIPYESAGFSGTLAALNGAAVMNCTWQQLAWAAITVGKAFGDENAFGIFSTFERIHRASMLYAYLRDSASGAIERAQTYDSADPSEKGNISYALGMTLAKLYAEIYLATPRLLHFGVYGNNFTVTTGAGNSRPDLIGVTTAGQWVVFEAKGRTNALETNLLADAKAQAAQILSIDGQQPLCRVALASYFSTSGLRFRVEDPPPKGKRRLDIKREQFQERYDSALRRLVSSRERRTRRRIAGHAYDGARFPEADLFLSVVPRLGEGEVVSDRAYLGGDGLLVELGESWSTDKMRLQPQLR